MASGKQTYAQGLFVVFTIQNGLALEVTVEGEGAEAKITVGARTIRSKGDRMRWSRRTGERMRVGLRAGALLCGTCLLLGGCGRDVSPREKRLEVLFDQINLHTAAERLAAIRELGQMREPTAVQPLIRLLREPRADVREAAAEALGRIGDRKSVEHVIKLLTPPHEWGERKAAARALGLLRDPSAVVPLLGLLRDGTATVAFEASAALGGIGRPSLGPVLHAFRAATEEGETNGVRKACVQAICRVRDRDAAPDLRAMLADSVPDLRLAAAQALCGMRERSAAAEIVMLLDDPIEAVSKGVSQALVTWGGGIAGLLGDGVASALRTTGGRLAAVGTLEKIAGPGMVKPLLIAMSGAEESVSLAVRKVLGAHAGEERVARLLREAMRGEDPRLALSALLVAGSSADAETVGAVTDALKNPDAKVRRAAVDLLGAAGGDAALGVLVGALEDGDELARVKAARCLARRGDARGQDAARRSVRDAAERLRKGDVPRDEVEQRAERAVLESAIDTVAKFKDAAGVEPLTALLQHSDQRTVGLAIEGLGRIGDKTAAPRMAALLKSGDADIVRRAVTALGLIGSPDVVAALHPLLESPDKPLVGLAAEAMGRIRHPSSLEPLVALLNATDEDVRRQAIVGLGRLGDPRAIERLAPLLQPLYDRIATEVAWAEEDARLKPEMEAYKKALAEWEAKYAAVVDEREKAARQAPQVKRDGTQKEHAPQPEVPPRPRRPSTQDRRDRRGKFETEMLVIEALGNIGSPAAFDLIARVLKGRVIGDLGQIDAHTRTVFDALANTRDPRAYNEVLAAFKQIFADDYYSAMRRYGLQSLARIDREAAVPVLAEALDTTGQTSYRALEGLLKTAGEMGDERVFPALLKWLHHDAAMVRKQTCAAFAAVARRAPSSLIDYMAEISVGDRSYVSVILAEMGAEAVPELVRALAGHRAPEARQGVAWALGHLRHADAVPAVLCSVAEEKHPKARGAAVWALGEIADKRAVAPLIPVLKDEEPETRAAAAVSLGQLGDVGARDALIEALKDDVAQVRAAAALALGRIGDEGARAALIAVRKDRNGEVVGNAGRALLMLDGKEKRTADAD